MTKTLSRKLKKSAQLKNYAGRWVAFLDGKRVIEAEKSLAKLMERLKKRKLEKKSVVFLVPRKDEGPYLL